MLPRKRLSRPVKKRARIKPKILGLGKIELAVFAAPVDAAGSLITSPRNAGASAQVRETRTACLSFGWSVFPVVRAPRNREHALMPDDLSRFAAKSTSLMKNDANGAPGLRPAWVNPTSRAGFSNSGRASTAEETRATFARHSGIFASRPGRHFFARTFRTLNVHSPALQRRRVQ